MDILNISPILNSKKIQIKNFSYNSIYFKGLQKDEFIKTTQDTKNTQKDDSQFDNVNQIEQTQGKIDELNKKIREINQTIEENKQQIKKFSNTKMLINDIDTSLRKKLKKNAQYRTLEANFYSETDKQKRELIFSAMEEIRKSTSRGILNEDYGEIKQDYLDLLEEIYLGSSYDKRYSIIQNEIDNIIFKQIPLCEQNIESISKSIKDYEKFKTELQNNSPYAYLYNPDLSDDEKILKAKTNIISCSRYLSERNLSSYQMKRIIKEAKLDIVKLNQKTYIIKNEKFKNINVEKYYKAQICYDKLIQAKKAQIIPSRDFACEYFLSESDMKKMVLNEKIELIGKEYLKYLYGEFDLENTYVDMKSEKTKETVQKLNEKYRQRKIVNDAISYDLYYSRTGKKAPKASKYYIETKSIMQKSNPPIPFSYLIEYGFARKQDIVKAVKNGELKALSKETTTPEGTITKEYFISTQDAYKTIEALAKLKRNNSDCLDFESFSKRFNLNHAQIMRAIKNDELEFLDEFISYEDSQSLYFNLTTPKNVAFIEKREDEMKQQALLDEQKAQYNRRMFSLRSTLAWYFAQNTKEVKSDVAKEYEYYAKLLDKIEKGEPLTPQEEISYKKYNKISWNKSGSDEFSISMQKAGAIIEMCQNEGIDCIDSQQYSEIREILEKYRDLFE